MVSKGISIFGVVIGFIGIVTSLYLMQQDFARVQDADKNAEQAHKNLYTTCQVLKNRIIDAQKVLRETQNAGIATSELIQQLDYSVQNYNDGCAKKTGVL